MYKDAAKDVVSRRVDQHVRVLDVVEEQRDYAVENGPGRGVGEGGQEDAKEVLRAVEQHIVLGVCVPAKRLLDAVRLAVAQRQRHERPHAQKVRFLCPRLPRGALRPRAEGGEEAGGRHEGGHGGGNAAEVEEGERVQGDERLLLRERLLQVERRLARRRAGNEVQEVDHREVAYVQQRLQRHLVARLHLRPREAGGPAPALLLLLLGGQ
mmetsp:Transcript_19719/g.75617  ORF Transcript_19719/g.75617 Transcript_19719/m.75617 type:complete len:210 (-) Transcript_19719:471-1100(-)